MQLEERAREPIDAAGLGGDAESSGASESRGIPAALACLMVLQYGVGGSLYPFLTLLLADRGLALSEVSTVTAAAAAASSILPFLWGWVADRHVAVNQLVPALHLAAAAVLVTLPQAHSLAATVVIFVVFSGFHQPTFALVSALSYHNLHDPTHQFGRLRLWGSVGWMLPSLPISLWLLSTGGQDLGFIVYLTCGIEVVLVLFSPCLPHTPPVRSSVTAPRHHYGKELLDLFRAPAYAVLLVVTFFVVASYAGMLYFSGPLLESAGFERRWIGPVLSLSVLIEIPLFVLLPRVLRRLGFLPTLALGALCALGREVAYATTADPVMLVCASALMAPATVFFLIGSSLAVNMLAPRELRATAQALLALVGSGLGTVTGLLLSGWMASGGEPRRIFISSAALAAVGIVLLPAARKGGRL